MTPQNLKEEIRGLIDAICYDPEGRMRAKDKLYYLFDQALSQQRKHYKSQEMGVATDCYKHEQVARKEEREKIVKMVEGMGKPFKENYECGGCSKCEACFIYKEEETRGYNQALSDLITNLKNLMKEKPIKLNKYERAILCLARIIERLPTNEYKVEEMMMNELGLEKIKNLK